MHTFHSWSLFVMYSKKGTSNLLLWPPRSKKGKTPFVDVSYRFCQQFLRDWAAFKHAQKHGTVMQLKRHYGPWGCRCSLRHLISFPASKRVQTLDHHWFQFFAGKHYATHDRFTRCGKCASFMFAFCCGWPPAEHTNFSPPMHIVTVCTWKINKVSDSRY